MAPCATTGGGLVTAYRDRKSAIRSISDAPYWHWTWRLNTPFSWLVHCIFHFTRFHCGRIKSSPKWWISGCSFMLLLHIHLIDHHISINLKAEQWPQDYWALCKQCSAHTIHLNSTSTECDKLFLKAQDIFFQITFIFVPQSKTPNLKIAVSWVVITGKHWGWSFIMRLLGSMGRSVSVAFTENTKCPSREQAGQSVNMWKVRERNAFHTSFINLHKLHKLISLTIKSVVAGRVMSIIAASHFVAGLTRNALRATFHTQVLFYITISR